MSAKRGAVVNWTSLMRCILVIAPLTVMFCLSPAALIDVGVDYVVPGGNPIQKVHPATYLALLDLLILFASGRSKAIISALFDWPWAVWYFISIVAILLYAGLFLSGPFMLMIDTFLTAGFFYLLIASLSLMERRVVARWFDILILGNSALGIYEFVRDWRLVPLSQWSATLGQYVYPHEYRSTALLGHPLTNGYVTVAYMFSLIITNRVPSSLIKYPLLMFHFVALFAFGSRGATGFLVGGIIVYMMWQTLPALRTGKISKDVLLYIGVGLPCIALVATMVLSSGFADRFIDRFINDKGSTETRFIAIEMFSDFPLGSLILGPPADLLFQMFKRYGIIGVESFWLNFVFEFGIVGCLIFFPGLFIFWRAIRYHSTPSSYGILALFFLCASTSTSISTKNFAFVMVTVVCMTSLDFSRRRSPSLSREPLPVPIDKQLALSVRGRRVAPGSALLSRMGVGEGKPPFADDAFAPP